jgi:hypothetical protein
MVYNLSMMPVLVSEDMNFLGLEDPVFSFDNVDAHISEWDIEDPEFEIIEHNDLVFLGTTGQGWKGPYTEYRVFKDEYCIGTVFSWG